jgi:hypothetical protein
LRHLWVWLMLVGVLGAGVPGASAAGRAMSSVLRDQPSCGLLSDDSPSLSPGGYAPAGGLAPELARGPSGAPADTVRMLVPADAGGKRQNRLIGGSLFGSGLFLCSWGITSWETSESQCCPTRNTQNVLKIVVGVVLINAGLVYLLGGFD